MKVAILEGPHRFVIGDEAMPTIKPTELLLRVAACGVCSSDLHVWQEDAGGYPRRLGHEVSGTVELVGEAVTDVQPGDPVAAWVTSGGYAEFVAVEAAFCLPAGDVPLDLALAEPLACAVNAVELAGVALGDDVVIIGAGFMGNLIQKLVTLRGPRHLIVADTRSDALARAKELGASQVVNVTTESLAEVVTAVTDGRGADIAFEVTGAQAPLLVIGDVTRMSGKLVIVGYHQGDRREIPLAHWNWMAFEIVNAHVREVTTIMRGMRSGMRLLTSGRLSLGGLVSHRFPLDQIEAAFAVAERKPPGFVKSTVCVG